MSKELNYIKRKTKHMTPTERFLFVEKHIYKPLRMESIKYVNGERIHIPDDIDFVAEIALDKEVKS